MPAPRSELSSAGSNGAHSANADRPPRGTFGDATSRPVATRLRHEDADRFTAACEARGESVAAFLRRVILTSLDSDA